MGSIIQSVGTRRWTSQAPSNSRQKQCKRCRAPPLFLDGSSSTKTILQEFYQVTFRKKIYETIEQLQNDLDERIDHHNNERTHQGKICEGRTPMQTLEEGKPIWREKFVA